MIDLGLEEILQQRLNASRSKRRKQILCESDLKYSRNDIVEVLYSYRVPFSHMKSEFQQ